MASPFHITVANKIQREKAVKRFFFSDSFVKPYVKVEGLPDLLLRYERDKEFNESGSDGNYCIFEPFIEGIIFFTIAIAY